MATKEQLAAIRKSAAPNAKLTVSRPAKLKRKPPRDVYHGTGNVAGLILSTIPKNDPRRKNKTLLKMYLEIVYVFAERENSGVIPCPVQIKELISRV